MFDVLVGYFISDIKSTTRLYNEKFLRLSLLRIRITAAVLDLLAHMHRVSPGVV